MTYVVKLSLPGYDIATATPEQCSIHSDYPPLKSKTGQSPAHFATLVVDFTATVTQNVTHTLLTVPHGYGYIPFTISNIVFNDGIQNIVGLGFAGVGANLAINAYSDATNFYVTIYDNFNWTSNSASLQVSYFIFAENGT
jgi:hypothetical protein